MKMGWDGAEMGIEKREAGAPKQAAQAHGQPGRRKCKRVGGFSWGTTESGRQSTLEEHRLATEGTEGCGQAWCWVALWLSFLRWRGSNGGTEPLLQRNQPGPLGGGEEAIVADLDKAFGQDMLQEAVDELFCRQGATFFSASLGGAVAKRDPVGLQLEEAVVAQGNPENIRRQVLQGIQTGAHAFTVD